jgi:glycosyltransferase involved in cell wall biosynthesis
MSGPMSGHMDGSWTAHGRLMDGSWTAVFKAREDPQRNLSRPGAAVHTVHTVHAVHAIHFVGGGSLLSAPLQEKLISLKNHPDFSRAPIRPLKIVHSESSLGWGGQEHRTLAELTGFRARGHGVFLIAPKESAIYERARAAGIPVNPVEFSRPKFLTNVLRLAGWLRDQGADILNTHSSRDGWVLGLAARLARVPLVLRTRHIDVEYPHPLVSAIAYRLLADHVLTTSDKITSHLKSLFALEGRIDTVPTGIDVHRFHPSGARSNLHDFWASNDLRPLVGMVAVLRSWKGHATFIEAASILHRRGFAARFVIVGGGPAPVEQKFRSLIDQAGLTQSILLTGHRDDVPEILRSLDVLVIASTRHEGIPQIGLQALATQTAVVGSDVGGTPEVIQHAVTGRIFPAGNATALADAITQTLEQKDLTDHYRSAGRLSVQQNHSFEHMLNRLENLYATHLQGQHAQASPP